MLTKLFLAQRMANCESSALNFSFNDIPPRASFLKQHIDPSTTRMEELMDCKILRLFECFL